MVIPTMEPYVFVVKLESAVPCPPGRDPQLFRIDLDLLIQIHQSRVQVWYIRRVFRSRPVPSLGWQITGWVDNPIEDVVRGIILHRLMVELFDHFCPPIDVLGIDQAPGPLIELAKRFAPEPKDGEESYERAADSQPD